MFNESQMLEPDLLSSHSTVRQLQSVTRCMSTFTYFSYEISTLGQPTWIIINGREAIIHTIYSPNSILFLDCGCWVIYLYIKDKKK